MTTREPARPLRRMWWARGRAASLPPSYTTNGGMTEPRRLHASGMCPEYICDRVVADEQATLGGGFQHVSCSQEQCDVRLAQPFRFRDEHHINETVEPKSIDVPDLGFPYQFCRECR